MTEQENSDLSRVSKLFSLKVDRALYGATRRDKCMKMM